MVATVLDVAMGRRLRVGRFGGFEAMYSTHSTRELPGGGRRHHLRSVECT